MFYCEWFIMENYLKNLRQNAQERNIPIMSPQTEAFLREQLTKYKPTSCVEIGSAIWYSTIFIASLIKEWWGQLISFEVSYPAYLEALLHIKDMQLTNITLYPCSILTNDVTKFIPKKADFLFVDGQKNQYGDYLEKLESIQAKENQVIIDDVIKYHDKLDWLYGYLEKKQISYEILPMEAGDGIMIISNREA